MKHDRWGNLFAVQDLLNKLFTNDFTIDVETDRFTFTTDGRSTTLGSFLYLQRATNGALKVVAVGESISDISGSLIRVDLFAPSLLPPEAQDRTELLEAFIRFAFHKVHKRTTLVRPTVVIRGVDKLSRVLHGYERGLLDRAVKSAGARSVTFA